MLVTAVLFDLYDTLAYLRSDLIDAERRQPPTCSRRGQHPDDRLRPMAANRH